MSEKMNNLIEGESQIATYNITGGTLEGFAVPVGLLKMQYGGGSQLGGSLHRIEVPDVNEVDAIPKGLYEKLLDLAQYDVHATPNTTSAKKTRKHRKPKRSTTRKHQE